VLPDRKRFKVYGLARSRVSRCAVTLREVACENEFPVLCFAGYFDILGRLRIKRVAYVQKNVKATKPITSTVPAGTKALKKGCFRL
jgi:hypothetical protein